MNGNDPSSRPPGDGPGELSDRVRQWLRRLVGGVRREVGALASQARERWPAIRARVVEAKERLDGGLADLLSRIPPLERVVLAMERGGERVGGLVRRAVRGLKRRSPSPRQTVILLTILLGAGWILWERCGLSGCPDVEGLTSYQPGGASSLLDRNGEPFADLAPMEHEVVPLDSLPDHVGAAFVAVEDRRFFDHGGVDWLRVFGAAWADIRARELVQGSSTIPMQLSRTLFSDRIQRDEKTFRRKLLEMRVAVEIEDRFTKREILELYLNHVYFGGGSYGIQAASRYYFGKDAPDLEPAESALLAGLLRAPSHYDPRRHPDAARTRRDLVLTLMEDQDYLSYSDAQAARQRDLRVASEPDRDRDSRVAPYFVQHVRRLLEEELGEELYERPLRILTTLDPRAQEAAQEALEAQLRAVERGAFGRLSGASYTDGGDGGAEATPYLQGAVVLMDVAGGEIRAWVGGRDYDESRYDRALLARRQAGSAFKPFVYAAALESGLAPSQPILDRPYRLARRGAPDWRPENYSGRFEGRMSMRQALVRSQNVPAVRLAAAVGEDRVRSVARRAGISGEVPASPVAALGVTAVNPLEMATAYAAFAGAGIRPTPRFVLRVEDEDGNVLLSTEPERTAVLDPAIAFLLTDMLRDVIDRGTGTGARRAGYRGPAAGKTGTTSEATDVWFVGYTPEVVGTVWVGFDEVQPLPSRATGGGVAAPVWGRMMARAYGDRPISDGWQRPSRVVTVRVDPETGMALEEGCRPRRSRPRQELFLRGGEPTTICPRRGGRNALGRFGRWLGSVFGSREPAPRIPGQTDPDLGVPRLPQRNPTSGAVPVDPGSDVRDPDPR